MSVITRSMVQMRSEGTKDYRRRVHFLIGSLYGLLFFTAAVFVLTQILGVR